MSQRAYPLSPGSGTYVPFSHTPIVRLSKVPGWGNSKYQYNGAAFNDSNLTTRNGVQYAVWVNDSNHAIVGKRTLPDGVWSTYDLANVAGNPLAISSTPASPDFHLTYRVAIDSAGYLHVWGNFHTDVFRYVRSTNPNDITAWADASSAMPQGSSNSYPTPVTAYDGTLLLFYRQGPSGNGDLYLNKLTNPASNTWTAVGKILDGVTDNLSPYWNHIDVEQGSQPHPGRIHLSWCWRNPAPYNQNICYAYSDDNGTTWHQSNGTAYTTPVRFAASEVIVSTPASDQGLLNTCGAMVDNQGRYHTTYFIWDATPATQIHHVYRDTSGTWHDDTVTTFSYKYDPFGTQGANGAVSGIIARPAVVCSPLGHTYLIYRHQMEGRRGTVRAIDVTPGLGSYPDFPIISNFDLEAWEPVIDAAALRDRGELHMVISPVQVQGSSSPIEYYDDTLWASQYVGVVTYDLYRMHDVASGKVKLPRVELLADAGNMGGAFTTTSNGVMADLTSPVTNYSQPTVINITPNDTGGRVLVTRAIVRGNITAGAGTMRVGIREFDETSSNAHIGATLPFAGGGNATKATPWTPLTLLPSTTVDAGWLHFYAQVSDGTTTGRVSQARLVLGYITI